MDTGEHPIQPYLFGASLAEIERLQKMEQLLRPTTRQFLLEAGVCQGMKILDLGCGPGTITLLVAELVGPTGTVIGIDRHPTMLETARARVQASGHTHVFFVEADLDRLNLDTDFDAVVGRMILLHLSNPVRLLRHLTHHLRPGGLVAFQEPDLTRLGASFPPIPVLEQMGHWIREAHHHLGLDSQFGLRLYQLFLDAGLPAPQLRCDAFVGAGLDWGWYDVMIEATRTALPMVLASGIATAQEAEIEALARRLRATLVSQHSATRAIDLISAYSRVPKDRAEYLKNS